MSTRPLPTPEKPWRFNVIRGNKAMDVKKHEHLVCRYITDMGPGYSHAGRAHLCGNRRGVLLGWARHYSQLVNLAVGQEINLGSGNSVDHITVCRLA